MDNNTIKQLMIDSYNTFFLKWRNNIPHPDSEQWDDVVTEVSAIIKKYDNRDATILILWFLEQLENRCKEQYGKVGRSGSMDVRDKR